MAKVFQATQRFLPCELISREPPPPRLYRAEIQHGSHQDEQEGDCKDDEVQHRGADRLPPRPWAHTPAPICGGTALPRLGRQEAGIWGARGDQSNRAVDCTSGKAQLKPPRSGCAAECDRYSGEALIPACAVPVATAPRTGFFRPPRRLGSDQSRASPPGAFSPHGGASPPAAAGLQLHLARRRVSRALPEADPDLPGAVSASERRPANFLSRPT